MASSMGCKDGLMLRDDTVHEERIGARDLATWPTPVGRAVATVAMAVGRQGVRLGMWSAAHLVLLVTALVGGLVAVGLTAVTAEVYESVIESDGLAGLDRPVLDAAVGWRNPGLDQAVTYYTEVGGPIGMSVLAVVATGLMVWRWRSRTPLLLMVLAAAGSLAMTVTGKELIGRARPPQALAVPPFESSPSFPSGHTLNATVLTAIVVYLLLRRLDSTRARAATVLAGGMFALSMGLTRVFLGHHWLTDVVAGWALGLAWAVVVVTAHRLFLTVRRDAADAGSESGAGVARA